MVIAFIIGILNIFLSGMHTSLIIVNKVDAIKVKPSNYVMVVITAAFGLYLLISSLGMASRV